jgi:hypothetical protein
VFSDLTFLIEPNSKFNELNTELQGGIKTTIEMTESVDSFKAKLQMYMTLFQRGKFIHFPSPNY